MNRITALILSLTLCITLCSCKSKNAKTVDNLISSIGEVTLNSEEAITQAEAAADALEAEDFKQLEHLEDLKNARVTFNDLVDRDTASQITESIDNLFKDGITLDSGRAIRSIRKNYDASSETVKAYIQNHEKLLDAEKMLSNLEVEKVEKKIDSIGTVTLDSETAIFSAQTLFNCLDVNEQRRVSNTEILKAASSRLEVLKSQEEAERKRLAKKAIAKLKQKRDNIDDTTWYHPSNYPYYVNSRSYVLPYIGQSGRSTWLRLRFHYTGNDWIFWNSITISVDGTMYYKYYDYFEVTRDNGSGDVWEFVDISPSSEDIQMLTAIADSKETVVRFEGDYKYDLTIRKADKTAIKEVLAAYEALNTI